MKKIRFILLAAFLVLLFVPSKAQEVAPKQKTDSLFSRGDSITAYAFTFMGKPYVYAACSPDKGFDCSGFTYFIFHHFGIEVPRASKAYATAGKEVNISEARRGDIIVFTGTKASVRTPGHVGIVISNPGEPLKFIHASSSSNHRGVVTTEYAGSAYPKRFLKIIRVF